MKLMRSSQKPQCMYRGQALLPQVLLPQVLLLQVLLLLGIINRPWSFHRLPNSLHQVNLLERLGQPRQLRGETLQALGVAGGKNDGQGGLPVS
ncbi:hypothetical protein SAMN04490183_1760 [Pseudomonas corrugata]|nr:hypothetical protein SAMN04490183_1760 [Pseudomonas corrugata]